MNASLAIAAGMELGISLDEAAIGLEKAELTEKRLNITGKNGVKIIDDTYNASPDSMRAALDVLTTVKGMRKVAVLSDMLELGEDSKRFHEEIGAYTAEKNIDILITAGEMAAHIAEKASETMGCDKVICYSGRGKLEADIRKLIIPGDVVLVKGSRGMGMENIVRKLLE
jgi:UDP-N-acetylmuramoyl-tripeptide--D-alanyl-D-alanine ligase